MRHIKTKTVQTILFAGIALFALCTSALADIDWKRMKRDLSIQESILDQFFDDKKSFHNRSLYRKSRRLAHCQRRDTQIRGPRRV